MVSSTLLLISPSTKSHHPDPLSPTRQAHPRLPIIFGGPIHAIFVHPFLRTHSLQSISWHHTHPLFDSLAPTLFSIRCVGSVPARKWPSTSQITSSQAPTTIKLGASWSLTPGQCRGRGGWCWATAGPVLPFPRHGSGSWPAAPHTPRCPG